MEQEALTLATSRAAPAPRRGFGVSMGIRIVVLRLVVLGLFLGLWQGLVMTKVLDKLYFGIPSDIGARIVQWTQSGILLDNLWVTYTETLVGWTIAGFGAIVLGYLTAVSKTLDGIVSPFVDAFAAAPRLALVPLFVIWFGLGPGSKVALVVCLVSVLVFVATNGAAKSVDQDFVILARTLRATRMQMALKVVWPWCMPFIFSGLRIGMSLGLTSAVVGEMIISQKGLGTLIAREAGAFDSTGVLAGVIVVMLVAYGTSLILTRVERAILKWRPDGLLA